MSKEIKTVESGISVCTGITKVVSAVYNDKEKYKTLLESCAKIVACGDLIKTVLGLVSPAQPNPVMLKLLELERKIQELSDRMMKQFNELKSFITTVNFTTNCITPVSSMMKYLAMTTRNPCHDTYGMFRENCKWPTPLRCALDMIALLEQDETNPLKKAMQADPLRKKSTFNKWKDTFNDLLGKLLVLECMVNGMFWGQNMIGPKELCEEIRKFQDLMHRWEEQYKNDKNGYWQGAKDLVRRVQENNGHVGNETKADMLKDEFSKILTNHAFYIIVYNHCGSYEQHSFNYHADQFFDSFRVNGCCVVVYRSFEMNDGNSRTPQDLKKLEIQVESCRHDTIPCRYEFSGFPKTLWESRFSNCGFVGMIRKSHNPVVRDVNSWKYWGPGWWITAHTSLHQNPAFHDGYVPEWILIAGYR